MRRARAWLRAQWGYGPLYAWQALMLARSALHEMDETNLPINRNNRQETRS